MCVVRLGFQDMNQFSWAALHTLWSISTGNRKRGIGENEMATRIIPHSRFRAPLMTGSILLLFSSDGGAHDCWYYEQGAWQCRPEDSESYADLVEMKEGHHQKIPEGFSGSWDIINRN